ncbi:MAG: mandelate racemase/muconate lactonizing enzyme family protein [Acidobacteria bacterium]|nr:mandelate racemase/muconate lactonizing enzyme family protein [Acidobacteriota bacterium]
MNRRSFLKSATAFGVSALAPAWALDVRVAAMDVIRIPVNRRGQWLLVRLTASNGLTGVGDASHGADDARISAGLKQIHGLIRGQSIFGVERLRTETESRGWAGQLLMGSALSGIEQALWDLQGKTLGVPCYELFGGKLRDRIRLYANINRSTEERSPEGFARMAAAAAAAGFDAIKLAPWDDMPKPNAPAAQLDAVTNLGAARARAVRDAIGSRQLLLDAHSHFTLERGLELARRMEELNLFWLEEVTPATTLADLAAINRAAKMPTAGGESIYGIRGFAPYIAAGCADIMMPDVKYCGGMLELKKIAAMCESAGLQVSPHGPASPIGNLAAAHVCAGLPNFLILEHAFGETTWRQDLTTPGEVVEKGHMTLSTRPGLGVELNSKTLAAQGAVWV